MNPVGNKEQRAAYLEGRFYVGQKKAWVQCGVVKSSLDGLDIAEEMADWASKNPKHCRFCGGWLVMETHVPPRPGDLEISHTKDCLGVKWAKWKGS